MKLRWLRVLLPAALVIGVFALAACGDDDDDEGGTASTEGATEQFAPPTAPPDDAKEGGELTVVAAGDVDYIDPGAAYYQFAYMIHTATQRQLAAWQPDDDLEPTPDIATDEAEVSNDGKTITFEIQSGIQFSPPVDREVVADDFKYAIERALLPGVANGYVAGYLGDVVGFADAQKAVEDEPTKAPDIAGITTPDDQTLIIELEKSSAQGVLGALSLPLGAPVPREYAEEFDAKNPSTYGDNQVATGPYMIENNSEGELTGYTSGKEIKLVRNPNWDADTDWRPAYLDRITVREGFSDTVSASKKILSGSAQVNGDFGTPNAPIKQAAEESPEQLTLTPSGGNRYIAFNTQAPPFDDINVRKAVVAGSNRVDLRNTRGGPLVGPVATHIIPPNFPGFEEAGGLEGPEDLDFVLTPEGDPDLSAEYFREAGMESGKCEGSDCSITMVGDDSPPGSDTASVFEDQLERMGFDVTYQRVAHDVMYTKFCNVPENQPEVCPNVGWLKDFQDAQSMLQLTFSGDEIIESNNSNWPLLDVPEINKAIEDAIFVADPDERAKAWGEIDQMITAQAPAVPWVWDNQANIQSADVAGVINLFNANWDLNYTSLKG